MPNHNPGIGDPVLELRTAWFRMHIAGAMTAMWAHGQHTVDRKQWIFKQDTPLSLF